MITPTWGVFISETGTPSLIVAFLARKWPSRWRWRWRILVLAFSIAGGLAPRGLSILFFWGGEKRRNPPRIP